MSLMSHEDMLRELELLPVWQLRQPLPGQLKAENAATVESVPLAQLQADETHGAQQPITPATTTPAVATAMQQAVEVLEKIEPALVQAPVLQQDLLLPLRAWLSEDSRYAFLMAPEAVDANVPQMETLLGNMIRAMQTTCRVEMTNAADKIFAEHSPKLVISFGVEPANRLFGTAHNIETWRTKQQQEPLYYAQIPVIVTYHPAHLLLHPADKALAWRDLCAAMKLMQRL